ncbi:MAG: tripartite tricarboxylate transporter substrate binding protein [Betaproteobacteria bacterium]
MKKTSLACALTIAAVSAPALAQKTDPAAGFPSRPIRVVVGFTPGGQPDIYARLIQAKLTDALHQQVVVDNRPGAGGIIGSHIVVDAPADGHTLLSVSSAHVTSPAVRAKMPFDTIKDLAGITLTANATYVLAVTPALNIKTVQELIALAKAKPGQINFSSAGTGSGTHFAGEMFKQSAGIDIVHIPFKGIPESLTDAISGRVQFTMAPIASSVSLIKEGRLRAVGVTSKKRSSLYPELPTLGEQGLTGFEWDSWGGLLAPAKTPRAVINKLNREVVKILAMPEIIERLRALGAEPTATTPEEMDAFVARQLKTAMQLAKKAGIEPQ